MKTVSLELSSVVETVYLKAKKIARTHENITFCNNLIRLCQTSRTYRQGNYTLKLTLIITSQRKVIKRYLNNSYVFRSKDLKAQANDRSLTSLSILFHDRLHFAFRLTRHVAVCIVELFSGQVTSFVTLIQLSFIQ